MRVLIYRDTEDAIYGQQQDAVSAYRGANITELKLVLFGRQITNNMRCAAGVLI